MADCRLVMLVDGEPITAARVNPTSQNLSSDLADPARRRAGAPIERVRSLFRGDRFSFSTRLRPEH